MTLVPGLLFNSKMGAGGKPAEAHLEGMVPKSFLKLFWWGEATDEPLTDLRFKRTPGSRLRPESARSRRLSEFGASAAQARGRPPHQPQTDPANSAMRRARYLIHDRDSQYTRSFDGLFENAGIKPLKLPPQSPNLNAYAERWVRSIKEECLNQLILFGERSLRHVLAEYIAHYHHERNHQGIQNVIPFPDARAGPKAANILKTERLGGLLNFYYRQAA